MKKSKVLLSAALAATMLAMPVFASTLDVDTTSGTTEVTYGVESTYTVTIPVDFNFTNVKLESVGNVSATDVLLANGKKLVVTMTSANYDSTNGYTLDYGTGDVSMIEYFIKTESTPDSGTFDTDFVNESSILEVNAGIVEKDIDVKFSTSLAEIDKAIKSGEHKDTLTFSCSITDI